MSISIEERREKAKYAHIKRQYGITREQYNEILGSHCPICLRGYSPANPACVDHDHATGEVRGILCRNCNHRVVGRLRDHELVQRIADYLTPPFTGWIVPKTRKKKRTRRPPRVKNIRRILNEYTSDTS